MNSSNEFLKKYNLAHYVRDGVLIVSAHHDTAILYAAHTELWPLRETDPAISAAVKAISQATYRRRAPRSPYQ